jgi:DNA adenine methylase
MIELLNEVYKSPKRPALRYHGGKWKLADWIISHFMPHRCYIEPFGGGASVLLKKMRAHAEIYNDLDGEIVNLFRVYRDNGEALRASIIATPFSRADFLEAWYPSDVPLEQARRTLVRSFMGFGSASATMNRSVNNMARGGLSNTGFRANSNRSGTTPARDWMNYHDAMPAIIERLRGVVIENRDATEVMAQHDCEDALHYVDPPYLPETRDKGGDYCYEMTEQQHIDLANFLGALSGSVVISGYESELYADMYKGWQCVRRNAFADGARARVEVLWIKGDVRQHAMSL